jgi:hypothetical protein
MDPPIDILQLAVSGEADPVYGVFTADLLTQVLSDCGAEVPEGLALDRAYLIGRIGASLEYSTYFLTNYQLNGERRMAPNPVVAAPQASVLHFTPEQIAQLKEVMRQVADGSIPVLGADGPPPADLPPMPADMLEIDGNWMILVHRHDGAYARIAEAFRMQKLSPSKAERNAYKSICLSAAQKLASRMRFVPMLVLTF